MEAALPCYLLRPVVSGVDVTHHSRPRIVGQDPLEFLGRQGAARIGATLITILVILRMVDAEFSLLTKGLAFIVIGAAFLGFNVFISRCRAAIGGPPA